MNPLRQSTQIIERPIAAALTGSNEIILSRDGQKAKKTRVECDIPCFWVGRDSMINMGHVLNTNLTFIMSMEGPGHYPILRSIGRYSIYSTGNMLSDVPCPWLNNLSTIFVNEIEFSKVEHKASFIARNCHSLNNREKWVRDIQSVYPVASIGQCMHNVDPWFSQNADWPNNKLRLMRRYMFHLSFENQNEEHMTEKLYYALEAGTIPVYLGDVRAQRWAPKNSFINAHAFQNGTEVGKYLKLVSENMSLFASYHAWRHRPPEPHLVHFFKPFERFHVKCRICQYANKLINLKTSLG
tara:strand:- start:1401 stop:2291 length:891 start_codon:yes stop_codon:yes gene_type:complete